MSATRTVNFGSKPGCVANQIGDKPQVEVVELGVSTQPGRTYHCLAAFPIVSAFYFWCLVYLFDCELQDASGILQYRSTETFAFSFVGNIAAFASFYLLFLKLYTVDRKSRPRAYEVSGDYVAAAFTDMVMATCVTIFSLYGLFKLALARPEYRTCWIPNDREEYYVINRVAQNGEVFTAYLMFDTIRMAFSGRLLKDAQATIHHVLFLVIGLIVRFHSAYALWASAAMAQEMSSPFLKIVRLRRAFGKSREQIAPVFIFFAFFFFVSRVFLYPIFAFQMVYDTYMGHVPPRVNIVQQWIVAGLGTAAISLQLLFFSAIMRIICKAWKIKSS